MAIPMAERCKANVCGRTHPGIAGSNPAWGMDVCVVYVVEERQKAKFRKIQTKKQVRIKYKERKRE